MTTPDAADGRTRAKSNRVVTSGSRQRWAVLIALLTAALSAAAWMRENGKSEDDVVDAQPAQTRGSRTGLAHKEQAAAVERVQLEKLRMRRAGERADDAFAPRSWRKPVPKMTAVANVPTVAPPPSAPPLPFVYVGKLLSEELNAVFLTQGERNLVVHEGDVVDAIYRVDKLSDAGLIFVHLPTGIRQTLAIGEPQ